MISGHVGRSAALLLAALAGCAPIGLRAAVGVSDSEGAEVSGDELRIALEPQELEAIGTLSPLPPPPLDPTNRFEQDARAARLGQWLFFDTRLSKSGRVSCATCHDPDRGWGDGRTLAEGEGRAERHAMSLWNVAHNRWYFWDGRADSLWSQALGPLEDPREHGFSRLEVAHLFADDADLSEAYRAVFGPLPELDDTTRFPARGRPVADEPDHPDALAYASMDPADRDAVDRVFANVGKALAAYQRQIVSRNARFDSFVEGLRDGDRRKLAALTASEQRGLGLFLGKAACITCHSGPNLTDREFHDTRVPPLEGGKRTDPGRARGITRVQADPFNGIGPHSDDPDGPALDRVGFLRRAPHSWSEFKTPTLRNVATTAPYMHQGQFATLGEVLHYYNTLDGAARPKHGAEQILEPLDLTAAELADLEAFLYTLTDEEIADELRSAPDGPLLRRR